MAYSKKRTAIIVCAWVAVGAFAFSAYGAPDLPSEVPGIETEVPSADAAAVGTTCNNGNNQGPPCMFPVERHTGGIVLGVGQLSGEQATAFGVGNGPNGNIPTTFTPLAPERTSGQTQNGVQVDETVGVGLNELDASKFFLYKSWKYNDPEATDADVNVWITANSATLTTEGQNGGCGDDTPGFDGSRRCDLLLNTGELSAGFFDAAVTVDTFFFSGTLGQPQGEDTPDSELSRSGFWIDDVEQDDCPIFDPTFSINPIDQASLCLGLIEDGGVTSLGAVEGVDVDLYNFMIRTHYAKAVRNTVDVDGDGDGETRNKLFTLNDGYLEIRHGKGFDRNLVFETGSQEVVGSPGDNGNAQQRANQWQDPTRTQFFDLTRRHGVAQGFVCDGNPDGDTDCDPNQDQSGDRTGGDETDGAYDDIHR